MHAEHELAGHADLDAQPRVLLAQLAAGGEGGQEVGVAGRPGGVHVDAVGAGRDHVRRRRSRCRRRAWRMAPTWASRASSILPSGSSSDQLGMGPSGLRVAAQVGHGAVLHRVGEQALGDLHALALVRHVDLDGLVRVVDLPELDHVDADERLVALQVLHAVADVLGPGAVVAQHDLVADVDGGEARRRGVDVEQVIELVLRERRAPWPAWPRAGCRPRDRP